MEVFHIIGPAPLHTNTFLLIGNHNHALVIDPAAMPAQYSQILKEHGATLSHILLTHGHSDHIGAVQILREETGAMLMMHPADAVQFGLHADAHYVENDPIVMDDITITPIFTPGHTPGSVCLACADLLFTGDTLFAGDVGRTDLPGGDYDELNKSLQKLKKIIAGNPQVLPGHEEFSTMDAERKYNRYLRKNREG